MRFYQFAIYSRNNLDILNMFFDTGSTFFFRSMIKSPSSGWPLSLLRQARIASHNINDTTEGPSMLKVPFRILRLGFRFGVSVGFNLGLGLGCRVRVSFRVRVRV